MKILQLVTKRQYRGAEIFAAGLSEGLVKEGHHVLFAGLYSPPQENPLVVTGAGNVDLHGAPSVWKFASTLHALIALIRSEKPDVIQSNGSDTLKFAVIAQLFTPRVPLLYRNISMIGTWLGRQPLKVLFYRWLFTRVDFVTSVGHGPAKHLSEVLQYPAARISVIRRGIPVVTVVKEEAKAFVRNALSMPLSTKVVVHAGNFSPEKNHVFLLDVFSRVKAVAPDIKLVLVGDGTTFDNVKSAIVKRGLGDTIFMAGFRKDIAQFLAAADLFVLCSTVEGIPGVIVEAGTQKTPTLAVNVGGVREVVEPGVSGGLLDGFDSAVFAANLVAMIDDRAGLREMGENAFDLAVRDFDPDQNTRTFIELYRSLIAKN